MATRFGCELIGDPDVEVFTVATLGRAAAGSISFLANPAYRTYLGSTQATAVVLSADAAGDCPTHVLIHDDPYLTFARIATELHPRPPLEAGIHDTAVVDPTATVDASAQVGALACIGAGSVIGPDVYVGPGCVIGKDCSVGESSYLHPNATLVEQVAIGKRTTVQSGVVLGSDGFGHAPAESGWFKVPQIGGVRIGDDVEIGAGTTIDRGAIDDTVIEDGVRLDNLIQIAHNCRVGAHTVIAAYAGLSGSTTVGRRCMIAGKVGFVGHISVCDDVVITGGAVVTKSITQPGVYSGSFPAEKDRDWKRRVARIRRLDELLRRVEALEKSGPKGGPKGEPKDE